MPELFQNSCIEQRQAGGSREITERALEYARKLLQDYEEPALDAGVNEALRDSMDMRKRQIPALDELQQSH